MINRKNYEAWFLDFAEGNLSEDRIISLNSFLKKNPDLQEEFDDINMVFLENEDVEFSGKELLKQNIVLDRVGGLSDFEVLAINKVEGDITKEEERELNSLVHFSDKLRKELKLLEKTKLEVDTSIIYKEKDNLKRKNRKIIPIWLKYVSSVAAMGLLLFFVSKIVGTNGNLGKSLVASQEKIITNKSNNRITGGISEKSIASLISNVQIEEVVEVNESIKQTKNVETETRKIIKRCSNNDNLTLATSADRKQDIKLNNNPQISISFEKPSRNKINLIEYELPSIAKLHKLEDRNSLVYADDTNKQSEILTPKQFIIKSVKKKLEIDDRNYNSVNAVELVSATLKKTRIGKVDYKKSKDTGKKYLAINIGRFGIERSWNSN